MREGTHANVARVGGGGDHDGQPVSGHAEQCVERYLELTGKSIESRRPVATPCIDDHLFAPEDFASKGEVAEVAARIVLKALYLARTNGPYILWSVNALARKVTKWTVACDKRLLRLMSYPHQTKDHVITSFVGNRIEDCQVNLFVDASFASDLEDSKSTTGAIIVLVGSNTWAPINWMCKKQGAVSHSSTEAEVIALESPLRMEGIPSLLLRGVGVVGIRHPKYSAEFTVLTRVI